VLQNKSKEVEVKVVVDTDYGYNITILDNILEMALRNLDNRVILIYVEISV
jgi:hypothetical protein